MTTRHHIVQRAREREDLEALAEEKDAEILSKGFKLRGFNVGTLEVMDEIYRTFLESEKNGEPLPAFDFIRLEVGHSRKTIRKAREALDIESFKLGRDWYWTYPKHSPEAAVALFHSGEVKRLRSFNPFRRKWDKSNRPYVVKLRGIMERGNYDVLEEEVYRNMRPYARRTANLARYVLGIAAPRKRDLERRWLWPGPKVQKWLTDLIQNGPMTKDDIMKLGSDLGYSENLVLRAKESDSAIVFHHEKGVQYWKLR